MMPRLQAEEALHEATVVAYATGHLENGRDMLALWKKAAGAPDAKPVRATPDALAAVGIGVRHG